MPDIFISYSRANAQEAGELCERLRERGIDAWIDKSGIEAAKSWSKEIVRAIDECSAFVVLISEAAQQSVNVAREVGIASEAKKPMLPVMLQDIKLSDELRYHLSGIQRVAYSQFDGIAQALAGFGINPSTDPPPAPPASGRRENNIPLPLAGGVRGGTEELRKSLMILPFEDLSPTADNQWFADGIVSELISALSNVKSLRLMDAATTKEYKSFKGHLTTYAREMSIRYFVQGDVRKFGDQIKISSRLLDIETGDHLWQDSLRGTMNDIFDIQEQVAQKVVEGLKIHLASDEKAKLDERGTENAEAYELYLKAEEYFHRHTKEGFQLAVQLDSEALKLDPDYANAYQHKAHALSALYRAYDRNPELLTEAESLCKDALRIQPDLVAVYNPLSVIYMLQGKLAEAEEAAREFIRKAPDNPQSHSSLGFFYMETGQHAKAIAPYEESVRLKPDGRAALFNLAIECHTAKDATHDESYSEKCLKWALAALPIEERHLKLHPDDEGSQQKYAILLFFSGRTEDARREAQKLKNAKDGNSLYNTACLLSNLGEKQEALETFRKAIEAGFKSIRHLKEFLTEDGFASLAGTPEYEEVKRMVEKLSEP